MEINPRLALLNKQPRELYSLQGYKALIHTVQGPVLGFPITIKIHKYNYEKGTIRVPCLSDYYLCPHCEYGLVPELVNYNLDLTQNLVSLGTEPGKSSKEDVCLLSFASQHKHAYNISSFNALGVYPVATLVYHDYIIKETHKIARGYLNG